MDKRGIVATVLGGLLLGAVSAALALAPAQSEFWGRRSRLMARDTQTVPGKVISWFRRGSEVYAETNDLARVILAGPAVRYSKLRLIRALRARGKWADLKAFLNAHEDVRDDWDACQYIMGDDPMFAAATNAAVAAGVGTEAEIRAVLREAVDR